MKLAKFSTKFSKKQIFLLSIPVFFSNLAIPFVGIVDTGLMGNLGDTKYLAATSIVTSVMTMVIWSFGFLRMGTTGLASQAFGARDSAEVTAILTRVLLLGGAGGLVIIALQIPLFWLAFQVSPATEAVESQARLYMQIRVLSAPAAIALYGPSSRQQACKTARTLQASPP